METSLENPFQQRATEMRRDEEAFLAIVSPEPVNYFLGPHASQLYDRLLLVRGTPGSGKTTLARLFEYPTLSALLRNRVPGRYRALITALADCGAIVDEYPTLLGCRLPLETGYRDFWEFPYPDDLKAALTFALIQARSILGWIRNLRVAGISEQDIKIVAKDGAEAAMAAIGGPELAGIVARAREVETALYRVAGALVAPPLEKLDPVCTDPYHPFDAIDSFEVRPGPSHSNTTLNLRPLIILDDAHVLHPQQFRHLERWLVRREPSIARWVLTRLDVLQPREALVVVTDDRSDSAALPGVTSARETAEILLQSSTATRREQRTAFRKMAKDMANRYLQQMPLFNGRGLNNLSDLLNTEAETLSGTKYSDLQKQVNSAQARLQISDARRATLLAQVDNYRTNLSEDLRMAMLRILMNRHGKRIPQLSFFSDTADQEPTKQITADSTVLDAARIHLLHQFDRPFFRGIDDLCDASSENVEQFLFLTAVLIDQMATQLTRRRSPSLDAVTQQRLLRERAGRTIENWNFPHCRTIRHILASLAEQCLAKSLEPNAPLGAGANAYGILQSEFDAIPDEFPDLAAVLHFAIAYNAVSIVPHYSCKGREWCLLELGGLIILQHGLTLRRGGFLEGTAKSLAELARESAI